LPRQNVGIGAGKKKQQCSALIGRRCAKIEWFANISGSPVWNLLGKTKHSTLTFYAKK
jgi:hypothetical protein